MIRSRMLAVGVAAMLVGASSVATAAPFSKIVVFGDSLSDGGNFYNFEFDPVGQPGVTTGFPPFPYGQRFSDGPVAVEYLAAMWGIPLVNYAFGGATTGTANFNNLTTPQFGPNLPGMAQQFAAHSASVIDPITGLPAYDPNALYVVWGGPNDIFLANAVGGDPALAVVQAVTNIVTMTATLLALGAQHVLVPGMPDLGLTPAFSATPLTAGFGTLLSSGFNAALLANLPAAATYFDTFGFLQDAVANPGAYGLTNVTDQCVISFPFCDASTYLFWDGVHPTTAAHMQLAEAFRAAVPEPAVFGLIALGLAAALRRSRRDRAARS